MLGILRHSSGSSRAQKFRPAHYGRRGDLLLVLDMLCSTRHVPIYHAGINLTGADMLDTEAFKSRWPCLEAWSCRCLNGK